MDFWKVSDVRQRDKNIIEDIERFRVLDRNQIIKMHFRHIGNKITVCNNVMKRLRRDGHVKADTSTTPYTYYGSQVQMGSNKVAHYKAIADFYLECCNYTQPSTFEVEYKTGPKGSVEPDIFMIWQGAPFFVEIQLSQYSNKLMEKKMERYKAYYHGNVWRNETWQPSGKKFFPYVWIVSEYVYSLPVMPFKVIQTRNVSEFVQRSVRVKK